MGCGCESRLILSWRLDFLGTRGEDTKGTIRYRELFLRVTTDFVVLFREPFLGRDLPAFRCVDHIDSDRRRHLLEKARTVLVN